MISLPDESDMLVACDLETSGLFVDDGARLATVGIGWLKHGYEDWILEAQVERGESRAEWEDEDERWHAQVLAFDVGPDESKRAGVLGKGRISDKTWAALTEPQMVDNPEWVARSGKPRKILEVRTWVDPNETEESFKFLMEWLSWQRLIGHNFKFDLHMLAAGHRLWGGGRDLSANWVADTMFECTVLEGKYPVGLKEVAARVWGADEKEDQDRIKKWFMSRKIPMDEKRYDLLPWEILEPYARRDVVQTLKIHDRALTIIEEQSGTGGWTRNVEKIIDRKVMVGRALFGMEERGVGFDLREAKVAGEKILSEMNRLRELVPWHGIFTKEGVVLDGGDLEAAKWFWFADSALGGMGLVPKNVTEVRGDPKLDVEQLRLLVKDGVEGAVEFSRYKALDSARQKWYGAWPALAGADGRLRGSFRQSRVVSGRLSIERVQLQAIPQEAKLPRDEEGKLVVPPVRQLLVAGRGKRLVEFDLAQAEVRVAAHFAQCRGMIEILTGEDPDVHGQTARMVFGVEPGDATWSAMRQVAKRVNFAMIYGGGARVVAETVEQDTGRHVEAWESEEWVGAYRSTFPEFPRLSRRAEALAQSRGFIWLAGRRQRWYMDHEKGNFRTAGNQLVQGSVAEAVEMWMVAVEKRWPGLLVLQIHDSLLLEIPEFEIDEVTSGVKSLGERGFQKLFKLPFRVDTKEW